MLIQGIGTKHTKLQKLYGLKKLKYDWIGLNMAIAKGTKFKNANLW